MAKLSLPELQAAVSSIVTTAKLSNATFSVTRDNMVGLLDKIGKIVTLDSVFTIDKLSGFDGEYLSFGKTIEEWQQDLIMPVAKDDSGATTLAPHEPTYRPVFYSYTIGKKVIPTTIRNNDIERAVHFQDQFISIVAMQYKRLEDSMAQYRYQVKREIIGKFYNLCEATLPANVSAYVATTAYSVGTLAKNSSEVGICVKAKDTTNITWANAVAGGYFVVLNLITAIAKPVDTSTGEAFLIQVKEDVEVASDVSEGHSLNGNTLGATEGLVLIVKQGIMPNLEVNTQAGAFHLEKVAIPTEVIVVKDFGSATDPYAVLMDRRAFRLHNTYNAVRDQVNAQGDFLNVYRHTEDTAYISRNAFVKFYKAV